MNDPVVVDSDVFSFWFKGDSRGRMYGSEVRGRTVCLSFMAVAELKRWALSRGWGMAKRTLLAESIGRYAIIPYDEGMADVWASISDRRARLGRPIECGDCWIAATAVRHGLSLLTHNGRHFADIAGLVVVSHSNGR